MTLWSVICMIMVRLVRICEAVCADEAISPTLRAEMIQTIDELTGVLEELGVPVGRMIPGTRR